MAEVVVVVADLTLLFGQLSSVSGFGRVCQVG